MTTHPTIRLTNTLTRRKEEFVPLDPRNVRMYVCGPTVYDRAHLGNARPVVVFDVLFRLLRHVYGEGHVTYVRNITDVDDKINARARETGRTIREITDETTRWFHEDMAALGALPPTKEPRATEWIGAMIAMIEELVAKGHAYEAQGHVLFRVRSYSAYGALSGRSVDDMMAGARVEVAPYKEDPLDFVLWKPSDAATPGWESPWGRGRPGWHIECSAMARELLGSSFDIHGGGLDLQFPHHENEIAQSRCADPGAGFAKVWMHNEMLLIDDEKMSKSLGNFVTVRHMIQLGVPREAIRFVLLGAHYRKPINWTDRKVSEAIHVLKKWYRLISDVSTNGELSSLIVEALSDDLNTPAALAELHKLAAIGDVCGLKTSAAMLGLLQEDASDWLEVAIPPGVAARLMAINQMRRDARAEKNYSQADRIRELLAAAGVQVEDAVSGSKFSVNGFTVAPTLTDEDRALLNVEAGADNLTTEQLEQFLNNVLFTRVGDIERTLGL